MEEMMKDYITIKCYELKISENRAVLAVEEFEKNANRIIESKNKAYMMATKASINVQIESAIYNYGYNELSQLAHKLGGEYLEIFERNVGERLDI